MSENKNVNGIDYIFTTNPNYINNKVTLDEEQLKEIKQTIEEGFEKIRKAILSLQK
jgi:hypothetical protein